MASEKNSSPASTLGATPNASNPAQVRVTANGEVLNSNERIVSQADAGAANPAAQGADGDGQPGKAGRKAADAAPVPESDNVLKTVFKRVQQVMQNRADAHERASEKAERDQANAQYFSRNGDDRGLLDTVDATGKPLHVAGDAHAGEVAPGEHHAGNPTHVLHDAVKHVQEAMEDQLAKHLPHQAPAPIREAEVIPVDHHNTEATHVAASQPSHAPEVAPPHTAFQSNETLLKEFMHVTHLDGQQAPAPISEAKVVEVHHDAPTTVAQETHAPIREAAVSEVRHTTPVADAQHVEAVAADVRAHTAEQVAQPIHSPDVKVSALAEGHVPEQVAQPIHQADVKVTALEGDKQATHSTAEAARVPAHGESSRTTEAALADAHSVLQGVHAVDSGRVGALAGDALHAARDEVKVGEAIASPHVEVAQLNSPSHIVHGHQPHGGAHSPAHAETTVAAAQPHHDARAHDSQTTNASTAAHQTDHLAGMHAPAASAMAAAAAEAREVAQSQARTSKTETVASSGPHFKGVGNLDKEAHDVLGAEHLTAMRESGRGEARSAQEFAGAVKPAAPMSFADDHKSRSDVHEALVEHWASKGVPVQEARTAVAALAPKLDEHLGQPGHPDAKLTYHAKGDVQVAIDHPHHHAAHPPTAAVAMNTLHEVHKHGMPHEGLAVAQANLGKEVDGVSRLELLDKFGPKVVNALAQEGFPHAEVAETKFHLEANMRDAGARTPEASKADALQALGVVATDSSSHINVTDKATGQSYQFTADKLRQDLGWAQEHEHQAPQAPAQQYARAETPGRDLYYGH